MRREIIVYALVAGLTVLPAALHPGAVVGDGADAFGTWWFYDWIRRCIEEGLDPSFTVDFFYPLGKNIFAHTGNNFVDAVWSVPFQWALGPHWYMPAFVAVILIGNALCFRPLAVHVLGAGPAAVAATLLYQTNPYLLFEVTAGRPTQALGWFLPAALLYVLRSAGWRDAVGLGVAVAMAGWTYWFSVYFLVFLLLPVALHRLWSSPERRALLTRWAGAVGVAVALVLPAALPMVGALDQGAVPGATPEARGLLDLPEALGNNVSATLHGLVLMERFGAPLLTHPLWALGLVAALIGALRQRGAPRYLWAALIVPLVFALGPVIELGGVSIRNPPYLILYNLDPFFRRLWFPYRAASVLFLPAALLLGPLLVRRPLLIGALGLGLGWQAWGGVWPAAYHAALPPPLIANLAQEEGKLIFLPMRIQSDALMWQTTFQQPTFGGMGESAPAFWPEGYKRLQSNRFIRALRRASTEPGKDEPFTPADVEAITRLGYRWVVLRPSLLHEGVEKTSAIDAISTVLSAQPLGEEGDAVLWEVRR